MFNILIKWWWRFRLEPNAIWSNMIKSIHDNNGGFNQSASSLLSGTWKRIRNLNIAFGKSNINLPKFLKKIANGVTTRFWEDNWMGNNTPKEYFLRLCYLERCLIPIGLRVEIHLMGLR